MCEVLPEAKKLGVLRVEHFFVEAQAVLAAGVRRAVPRTIESEHLYHLSIINIFPGRNF